MTSLRNNAPRRYFVDPIGRRVLIGLTPEETCEFERLDGEPTAAIGGTQAACENDGRWPAAGEQRWLELYAKHEGAWKAWMAQNRAEKGESFSLS
ncbi:hypothetical protein NLM33_17790 [Bradyrhizobium sp. CCGUVB1N3]|uniref:hypothetical protein n=1 Tax=Bradyrhizobium sp. CCGUVB1N3 TaxID=2949629 RepID=UPI0020B18613|nr:hypothetical protein [Bradyrhizobium sp. CCGUVB1N3]MCP3472169.1 hypothetical protein [Bradyrhizobium sp. CCGUVB1N3]